MKYPVQLAHPFRQGDFASPVVDGIPTQAIVKCRWPDGSIKHALFCFYLDGNANDLRLVKIVEGAPLSGPSTTVALDASVEMNGVTVKLSELPKTSWFAGPVSSCWIYADHTGAHDLPSGSGTKARPIFEVTYWPEIGNARIRFILENANIAAAGECHAPHRLLINGVEVFSNLTLTWQQQMMPYASRQTKSYWLKPQAEVYPEFDIAYLRDAKAIPNYDTSIAVNSSAVDSQYASWLTSDKNVANTGSNQWGNMAKAMGTAGARGDLGPYPTWTLLWLYTGDKRMRETDRGNADLAAMYACHWRDGARPIRITDHPGMQLKNPLTVVNQVADMDTWKISHDPAHEINPFFILYLTTGEFFYLEEMIFWACYCAGYSNGSATNSFLGRGPTGKEGGIPGATAATFQVRGQGWVLRGRSQLAWICPDDMEEKEYFTRLTNDAIKIWEGQRNVGDMTDPLRAWGRQTDPQDSPIHLDQRGNNGLVGDPVDGSKATSAISPWEVSFKVFGLLMARQYGFPTQPLIDYLKPGIKVMGEYLAAYRIGTMESSGWFLNWTSVQNAMIAGYDVYAWWLAQRNLDHGYTLLAGQQVIAADEASYWAWFKTDVYDRMAFSANPKWAILPRV